jgi:hypothetical protein
MSTFDVAKLTAADAMVNTMSMTDDTDESGDLLREAVGGWLQALNLTHPRTGAVASLWMDEEGKFKQGARVNWFATTLADICDVGLAPDDKIVGDVVLTGLRWSDVEGEGSVVAPLDDDWWELLRKIRRAIEEGVRKGGLQEEASDDRE